MSRSRRARRPSPSRTRRSPALPNARLNPFAVPVAPSRDARRLDPRFETLEAAEAERQARLRSLARAGAARHEAVRARLQGCAPWRRCLSPACPVCFRQHRLWFVAEALRVLAGAGPLAFVTLVDPDAAVAPGDLDGLAPGKAVNALRQRLRRAGVPGPVLGGLDGEYDADRGLYQPHFHLVCPADQVDAIRAMASRRGCRRDDVYRPCLAKGVHDLAPALSYCAKGHWLKRMRGSSQARIARRLDPPMHAAWLVWRAGFELGAFCVLLGVRRRGGRLEALGHHHKGRERLRETTANTRAHETPTGAMDEASTALDARSGGTLDPLGRLRNERERVRETTEDTHARETPTRTTDAMGEGSTAMDAGRRGAGGVG